MGRHKMLVQDIMRGNPVTASPDTTLVDAFELMADNEVRRLPVVTSELVGMVTLSDIVGDIPTIRADLDMETRLSLSTHKVRDVMAWGPVTVSPDLTIQEAAERMLEYQVSGLPVVEGSKVVGVITESDIFRLVVESWADD